MIIIWHLGLLWEAITILDQPKHVIGMCYAKKTAFDFYGPRPMVGIGLIPGLELRAIYLAWDSAGVGGLRRKSAGKAPHGSGIAVPNWDRAPKAERSGRGKHLCRLSPVWDPVTEQYSYSYLVME